MTLHDRIMALPLVAPYAGRDYEAVELRNHASEIAKEADELMTEMAEHLASANFDNNTDMLGAARLAQKYNTYMERKQ